MSKQRPTQQNCTNCRKEIWTLQKYPDYSVSCDECSKKNNSRRDHVNDGGQFN